MKRKSFNLVSLGCPKNRVDSERILASMESGGYDFTDDPVSADVIIINTCAFIEPAAEESINTILDYSEDNPQAFLVVAGCLPLRYKEELGRQLPEVGLFLKPDQIPDLPGILHAVYEKNPEPFAAPGLAPRSRIITTPGYAYLKIAEGCFRSCHYCTIPDIRGRLRSEAHDDLVREAEYLASNGVRTHPGGSGSHQLRARSEEKERSHRFAGKVGKNRGDPLDSSHVPPSRGYS